MFVTLLTGRELRCSSTAMVWLVLMRCEIWSGSVWLGSGGG